MSSTQRWKSSEAAVDCRVPAGKVHGCGGIQLPAGSDEGSGIMQRVIGAPCHPTDLIMDLGQVSQLCRETEIEFRHPGILIPERYIS